MLKQTVRVKDRGFDRAIKNLEKLGNKAPQVYAGVVGPEALDDHGGITNVEIATFHEFGTDTVPQRSFLRSTADEKQQEVATRLGNAAGKTIDGAESHNAFGLVGAWFIGQVQKKIRSRIPPPLADSTVQAKGSDMPLIDTGQMIKILTWVVRDGKK